MEEQDEVVSTPSGQTFRLVRRGYDPAEVQAFAYAVVEEISSLRDQNATLTTRIAEVESRPAITTPAVVDEAAVASFLGEESLRVMAAVRTAAEEIRAKSDNAAANMLKQAEDEATATTRRAEEHAARIRREAEEAVRRSREEADEYSARVRGQSDSAGHAVRAEAQAYAETVKEAAERDVAQRRADAESQASYLISEARQQRSDMLASLASRRDRITADIERLIASRRVLLEALDRVRMHADEAHAAFTVVDVDGIEASSRLALEVPELSSIDA